MGQIAKWAATGAAVGATILAAPAFTAARETRTEGLTVQVTGAYRHTFHQASCQVSPPQKGNPTVTWGIVQHLLGDRNLFAFVQTRSHSPVGRINLRTTDSYTATFEHAGNEWQAGWLDPGHLGSGTARVAHHVAAGSIIALLAPDQRKTEAVRLTATWRCAS